MKASKDFGIILRKKVVQKKAIDMAKIMSEFHLDSYYDESDDFISLGPFFGSDSADECMRSLESEGLVYIDDFFIMEAYFPPWCRVEVFDSTEENNQEP